VQGMPFCCVAHSSPFWRTTLNTHIFARTSSVGPSMEKCRVPHISTLENLHRLLGTADKDAHTATSRLSNSTGEVNLVIQAIFSLCSVSQCFTFVLDHPPNSSLWPRHDSTVALFVAPTRTSMLHAANTRLPEL
jgi:hypothetical protein